MPLPLKNQNTQQSVGVVWEALHAFSDVYDDEQWGEICTAMAWIQEALGCEEELDG